MMPQLPPGPRSMTLSTIDWIRNPIGLLLDYKERYGDPHTSQTWGLGKIVVTTSPEGIRELYTAPPDTFTSPFEGTLLPLLGKNSIFLLDGADHKKERSLLLSPFHGQRMKAYCETIQKVAFKHAAEWKPGQSFQMYDVTQSISLNVIIQVIFGIQDPARVKLFKEKILNYILAFTPLLGFFPVFRRNFWGIGPWAKYSKAKATIEALMVEEIENRRQEADERDDILSLLLAARYEDGRPMTNQELLDELKSVVFAGYETVAIALAWAFYWLHRLPGVYSKLEAELSPLGDRPDPNELVQLPYLDAVVDESLRLYSPVPSFPRQLKQPLTLRGYDLPAGIYVTAPIMTIHLDPDIYPEPTEFRPERFLERKYSPFEYLPFGGGARRCVGAAFAEFEMKIVLGSILARHRLSLANGELEIPVTRTFTTAPKWGVKVVYEGKKDS